MLKYFSSNSRPVIICIHEYNLYLNKQITIIVMTKYNSFETLYRFKSGHKIIHRHSPILFLNHWKISDCSTGTRTTNCSLAGRLLYKVSYWAKTPIKFCTGSVHPMVGKLLLLILQCIIMKNKNITAMDACQIFTNTITGNMQLTIEHVE